LVWVYMAAVTSYLDPERLPLRLLLLALPAAFGAGGLVVAGAYATMQIGRTIFAIEVLRGAEGDVHASAGLEQRYRAPVAAGRPLARSGS
jgi:low temperature requirement protein LtrA